MSWTHSVPIDEMKPRLCSTTSWSSDSEGAGSLSRGSQLYFSSKARLSFRHQLDSNINAVDATYWAEGDKWDSGVLFFFSRFVFRCLFVLGASIADLPDSWASSDSSHSLLLNPLVALSPGKKNKKDDLPDLNGWKPAWPLSWDWTLTGVDPSPRTTGRRDGDIETCLQYSQPTSALFLVLFVRF